MSPPEIRFHGTGFQAGVLPDLAQLEFFHITQQEDAPFAHTEPFNHAPDLRRLIPSNHLRFRGPLYAWHEVMRTVGIDDVNLRLAPKSHSPIAPMIFLKIDGNSHQPGAGGGFAAESGSTSVGLEKAFLSQRLREVLISQRSSRNR